MKWFWFSFANNDTGKFIGGIIANGEDLHDVVDRVMRIGDAPDYHCEAKVTEVDDDLAPGLLDPFRLYCLEELQMLGDTADF